jgi:hypothetical protein
LEYWADDDIYIDDVLDDHSTLYAVWGPEGCEAYIDDVGDGRW